MPSRTFAGTVLALTVLIVATLSACANDTGTGSVQSGETPEWRDQTIGPETPRPVSAEQQAAMQLANEALADDVAVWAKSHYGDDGDVVVNLKTGWRDVVGDQVDQLIAAAPAPITAREVEHSDAELMANAKLDDPVWESDLAGARAVTASVSSEENKLVIGLTVVNEDTVKAAQAVFGADVLFRQDDAPELGSGDQ